MKDSVKKQFRDDNREFYDFINQNDLRQDALMILKEKVLAKIEKRKTQLGNTKTHLSKPLPKMSSSAINQVQEALNQPQKRGRGRPKKVVAPDVVPVVKRGRGRPKKTPATMVQDRTVLVVAPVKRGRGRPRKEAVPCNYFFSCSASPKEEKRGRGRPKGSKNKK